MSDTPFGHQNIDDCKCELCKTVLLADAIESKPDWWISTIPTPPFDIPRIRKYWAILVEGAKRTQQIERELNAANKRIAELENMLAEANGYEVTK